MESKTIYVFVVVFGIAFIVFFIGGVASKSIEEKHKVFVETETSLTHEFLQKGMYACCLETPCHTCLSLTPYHGEGAECECLADVINGEAPCGECIGGILSGRGNKFLAPYFTQALSEKFGEKEAIERIIEEQYS